MFNAFNPRAASAYQRINVETAVHTMDQHQIVSLLLDGVLGSLASARGALARGDIPAKCAAVSKALKIIEEGLRTGLDTVDGGELASNLEALYDYATLRLILANSRNDDSIFQEVQRLIEPIAQSWKAIKSQPKNVGAANTVPSPHLSLVGV